MAAATDREFPRRVASDDLAPGMLVTILEGQRIPQYAAGAGGEPIEFQTLEYYSAFRGDPLRVLEVQIPYLTCEAMHLSHRPRLIIDTRRCVLMGISEDYAKSAAQPQIVMVGGSKPPRKWWQIWGRK